MPRYITLIIVITVLLLSGRTTGQVAYPEQEKPWQALARDTATVGALTRASLTLRNNPDSAIFLLEKAFALSRSIGYTDGCASALLGTGTNLFNKGELDKAKAVFLQAYPYCRKPSSGKKDWLLFWNNNMASVYAMQGKYDSAAVFYYNALDHMLRSGRKDTGMYTVILANLGTVWQKSAQYSKSLFYARKGLALAMATHDSDQAANICQNIGLALNGLNDSIQAQSWLQTALSLHLKRKNYLVAQMDYCALAINARNTDTALHYYAEGLALGRQTGMEPLHKLYIGLGFALLQKKQYDEAALYLEKGLQKARELGFTDDLTYIYSGLASIYTATHRFELANKYNKAYADLRDSLTSREKILAANTLEVKYRTAEKDREITETRLQLAEQHYRLKQKNYWILFISCVAALLMVIFYSFQRSLRRKVRLEKQQVLNAEQQQEISNLKAVMAGEEKERTRIARELHDGIMVQLAVIKMKLRKVRHAQQPSETKDMGDILTQLDDTAQELRRTAHNLMPDMLLETGLTDAVFYYCNSLQKEADITILFQHYGTLPALLPEPELYIYRIVQELLQNVIKHAHASKVLVQMNYHNPFLSLAVEDNGIGFDQEIMDAGMGLKSIHSRLKVLKGTMDIQSSRHTGTAVFIEINIESFIKPPAYERNDTGSYSR